MKSNQGRLQTGEHILARIIQNRVGDALIGVCKFNEDFGTLEVSTETDLREFNLNELQDEVNRVVGRGLKVEKVVRPREEAEKEVDLRKVPDFVKEVRVVKIGDFDKRPCRDPHVDNTSEIGKFKITKLERVGNNRYRFTFEVE